MVDDDRRRHDRFSVDTPVWVSFLNGGKGFGAVAVNHGRGGICLQSEAPLKPSACLLVRPDNRYRPTAATHEDFRQVATGEVRWSRESDGPFGRCFLTGVKYHPPEY